MTSPVTILLLPHDPKLLADGPGGSRAPRCWRHRVDQWTTSGLVASTSPRRPQEALLLAHDGKVVEQARGWLPDEGGDASHVPHFVADVLSATAELLSLAVIDLEAAAHDLGTIIILDAYGREVTT